MVDKYYHEGYFPKTRGATMSQLPGFSKYLKFSNVEVDQTFTESMQHLNAQSEDPENYTWLLGTIQMQSSKKIPIKQSIDVGGGTIHAQGKIQPSWGLYFQGEHAIYEERNMNPTDVYIPGFGREDTPITISGVERYHFYHDHLYSDAEVEDYILEKYTQYMKKFFYFEVSIPSMNYNLYRNARFDYVNQLESVDLLTKNTLDLYPNSLTLRYKGTPYSSLDIVGSSGYLYLNGETLKVIPRHLTLESIVPEVGDIFRDHLSQEYVYNNSTPEELFFVGSLDIETGRILPIQGPMEWKTNTIFFLGADRNKFATLTKILGFNYDQTVTSKVLITVPKTVSQIGSEDTGISHFSGVLDISSCSETIGIITTSFEDCEDATLRVSEDQWTALESRIADGMLDNKIQIQKKSEVQA